MHLALNRIQFTYDQHWLSSTFLFYSGNIEDHMWRISFSEKKNTGKTRVSLCIFCVLVSVSLTLAASLSSSFPHAVLFHGKWFLADSFNRASCLGVLSTNWCIDLTITYMNLYLDGKFLLSENPCPPTVNIPDILRTRVNAGVHSTCRYLFTQYL